MKVQSIQQNPQQASPFAKGFDTQQHFGSHLPKDIGLPYVVTNKFEMTSSIFDDVIKGISKLFHKERNVKPFRIPVNRANAYTTGTQFPKNANLVKEFSNPKAKELYAQMKKAKTISEKLRLYREMGEYRIVDLDLEKAISKI